MSPTTPVAPTYNELFKLVSDLQEKVEQLQKESTAGRVGEQNASAGAVVNNASRSDTYDYRVLPDLNKAIKTFDGCESAYEADDWLKTVEGMADLNCWPYALRMQFVRSYVVGAARNWFIGRDFANWDEFTKKFRSTFVRQLRMADRWEAMQKRRQAQDEHIMAYLQEKSRLCRALALTFSESRDYIIQGIYSKELAMYVLGRNHDNEDTLLGDLLDWTRMNAIRTEIRTEYKQEKGNSTAKTNIKSGPRRGEASTTSKPKWCSKFEKTEQVVRTAIEAGEEDKSSCWVCRKVGHWTRDCPLKKARKCFACGAEGHFARDCKSQQTVNNVTMSKEPEENPYIKYGAIQGVDMTVLLDTGSYYTLLRSSVAERCNLKLRETKKMLFGLGSVSVPSVRAVGKADVMVTVDGVEAGPIRVLVVPDSVQRYDMIVGRNWLDLDTVTYKKEGGKFTLCETQDEMSWRDASVVTWADKLDTLAVLTASPEPKRRPLVIEDFKHVNAEVTDEDRTQLLELINRFRSCFALGIEELGCTRMSVMEINEVEGSEPVTCRPYKTTAADREAIAEIIGEWKQHGVVVETDSPYASPVILVKQGAKNRLCVDYRKLNKQVLRHNFPLPDLQEQVESLRNGNYFVQLDLATGYLQVPLSEAAQTKTAFITPDDTGQFTRMPFGLAGAPGEFTRLMRKVLGNLRDKVVKNYLDDWVIDAVDWSDMLNKLTMVLERLKEANLTLRPSKCLFGARSIEFLGFVVGEGKISPGKDKSKAIEEFPTPKDVHAIRRFLGLTGFFRRFVRNYATLTEPLSRLTKKGAEFEWSTSQQAAFKELKRIFVDTPIFCMFNPKAAVTEVHTDASAVGLGAMLLQSAEEGAPLQIVYCISKKLGVAETHYHSSKLELMSMVWAVDKWRHFLLGIKFSIITDCQALVYLRTHKATRPQVTRWYDVLQEYNFDIFHRPGKKMAHVDALSRDPISDEEGETLDEVLAGRLDVCMTLGTEDKVRMAQQVDEEVRRIVTIMLKPENIRTKAERAIAQEYSLRGKLLYRTYQGKQLFVMPKSMRKSIVVAAHDLGGHLSVDKTVSKITQDFWFVGLRRYVRYHIRMCMECLMTKKPRGKQPGVLHPIPPGRRPFEVVHGDHIGPFVTSTEGNRYILVLVDNLTKFVSLFAATDTSTEGVLYAMDRFVNRYGLPKKLITDRGTCFTSKRFENFCEVHGISHILNSTRRPQANGQVERINSVILAMLISKAGEEDQWDTLLSGVQRQINNSESKVTRHTPFELLHGYRPRFELGRLRDLSTTAEEWLCPSELWEDARNEIVKQKEKVKTAYDKHRHNQTQYVVGEVVVMTRAPVATGMSTKLQERYRGPLVVTEVLPNDVYRVSQLAEDGARHYATTAHVSQLKSWKLVETSDDNEDTTEEEEPEQIAEEADVANTEQDQGEEAGVRKSTRLRRKPKKLNDYE